MVSYKVYLLKERTYFQNWNINKNTFSNMQGEYFLEYM